MALWIEGAVALVIMAAFVVASFFRFKPEHVEHHPLRVRVGAGIQGLVIGLLVAFVILPLRLSLLNGGVPTPGASLSYLPAFLLLVVIRRGALLRAPIVKTYLRAYRRASLLRMLDVTNKELAKLDEIEGRILAKASS